MHTKEELSIEKGFAIDEKDHRHSILQCDKFMWL